MVYNMGYKDIGIRKSEFLTKTQFLSVETAWRFDNFYMKRM